MKENLPQEYKNNIFHKFLGYLKKLFHFGKKDETEENNFPNEKIMPDNHRFLEKLKVDVNFQNAEAEQKKLLEDLNKNPELLENFSNEKLEKILQSYLAENEKKRAMLKKLTM